jgi:hypothetical protein
MINKKPKAAIMLLIMKADRINGAPFALHCQRSMKVLLKQVNV